MAFSHLILRPGKDLGRYQPGPTLKVPSLHLSGVPEEKPQYGQPLKTNPRPPECYANASTLSYGGSVSNVLLKRLVRLLRTMMMMMGILPEDTS